MPAPLSPMCLPPSLLLSRRSRSFTPRSNGAFPFLLLIRKARKPVVRPGGSLPFLLLTRGHQHAPATVYTDLVSACIAWLRTNNSGSVATAFGDAMATPKFFEGRGFSAVPPYVIFEEPQGDDEYSAMGNYITNGQLVVNVFSGNGQVDAKGLADLVRASLNDAPLVYQNERLMMIRSSARSVPVPGDPSIASPALFQRAVTITLMASGQIA